jgi:hypothetical protein
MSTSDERLQAEAPTVESEEALHPAHEEVFVSRTIQLRTTVLPGNRIEIHAPELPEGSTATVLITIAEEEMSKRPFRQVLGDYAGGQLFKSAEEVDAYLRAERDSWDR